MQRIRKINILFNGKKFIAMQIQNIFIFLIQIAMMFIFFTKKIQIFNFLQRSSNSY